MRVLITHELYPPDIAGGGEHVVEHMAAGLLALGVDVQVLTTGDPRNRSHGQVPTTRLPVSRYRFNLAVNEIAELAAEADLIQTFTYHACLPSLLAARRRRKPVVMLCLGLFGEAWTRMRGPVLGRAWSGWERFLVTRKFDRVLFLSQYSMRRGLDMGVLPARAVLDEPGVDLTQFYPTWPRQNTVLFVGKLDVRKGIDVVLDVASALPHVSFQVVGWGPEADRLSAQAPANVEFIPFPGGDHLGPYFRRAAMFFLPSRAETFGMAILQAMASGCAVVSTVPLEYHGAHVAPDDRSAMIAAIDSMWKHPGQTSELGRRNAEIAQQFTWERFCGRLVELYGELLDQRNSPLPTWEEQAKEAHVADF